MEFGRVGFQGLRADWKAVKWCSVGVDQLLTLQSIFIYSLHSWQPLYKAWATLHTLNIMFLSMSPGRREATTVMGSLQSLPVT